MCKKRVYSKVKISYFSQILKKKDAGGVINYAHEQLLTPTWPKIKDKITMSLTNSKANWKKSKCSKLREK